MLVVEASGNGIEFVSTTGPASDVRHVYDGVLPAASNA
jgi:hypothetical protein